MKLSFYGADREVTGSCHGVECNGKRIIIDCGMVQGRDDDRGQDFPFEPNKIDYVIITHAHIDHTGRLPLLVRQGYRGKIFATGATVELMNIMLRDSAHIQEFEAGWTNRKNKRAGKNLKEPLYTMQDAEDALKLTVSLKYGQVVNLDENISFRMVDAGHLLGSAFVELWLTENGVTKKIVYSGDIGNTGKPIIRDPQYVTEADIAVMESTYGDRNHPSNDDTLEALAQIIDKTLSMGGNVVFPSFAVGRTQELLYSIREMKERKLIKSRPDFKVFVDSPLGSAATKIYEGDLHGYLDEETIAVMEAGKKYLSFEGLNITATSEESKALNLMTEPKVIISSSGMCEAGRIRHHLKYNLWRPECAIIFVGFQAQGTLGRILVDKAADTVKLFNEEVAVRAQIYSFQGLSSHADRDGLLKWIRAYSPKPEKVFVVHGEEGVADLFTETLKAEGFDAYTPKYTAVYDVLTGQLVFEGIEPEEAKPLRSWEEDVTFKRKAKLPKKESPVYQRLHTAGLRLLDVISRNYGGSNKDLAAFTDQIYALIKRWDRE
jgi:metallo-beta-lactamase family protein